MRLIIKGLLLSSVLLSGTAAAAGDPVRGEERAFHHRCMTCHGVTGVSKDPRYPHIAGQKEAYLVSRLKSFKAREHPSSMMTEQATMLSDEDIADISAYYARQQRP
jgi:cytochrome c553